jgi:hypothetical protein
MPTDKDFKRLVRGRMQKTGESYTAARAILLQKPARKPAAPPSRPDYAKLAGMSDAVLKAKTGCSWDRWVAALDYVKADSWSHREIAQYVHEKFKVPDWWTQTVTVGYERIKGLREIGQRRNGSYEATRSKTIPVPLTKLYRAFSDARVRRKWLPDTKLKVRSATPEKYVRISWEDGTSVEVVLTAKGDAKASAAVSHVKLASKEDIALRKAYWGERLDALATLLAPGN